MLRHMIRLSILMIAGLWVVAPVKAVSIPIENASFESPLVDPGGFGAMPFVESWTEIDLDTEGSSNTGVFANTPAGSPDHVINADGLQLAFLGSQQGNALDQDLAATYKAGYEYRLTVGVGVSMRFPPADSLELVLYYRNGSESVDIASQTVKATGLSATQLQDFSVFVPKVEADDAWEGKTIGVAIRAAGQAGGFWDLDNVRLTELLPVSIPIKNASFESPVVDPAGFGALPLVDGWVELDVDTAGSTNTGVFLNTAPGSPDHVTNADGLQLAFLGSQQGNALEQDLAATYKAGCEYRLTTGVGVSMRFPPVDSLELVLYYRDGVKSVDIASQMVEATGLSATLLQDFSVYLPKVEADDAWAGKTIGVAIRAAGLAGGFWDLDNVRLVETLPVSIPIENASFESPVVDPAGFGALPFVESWTEIDLDAEGSTNTGVFLNTAPGSPDHVINADALQLAFLGSQQGNGLEQDLATTYEVGSAYRLSVGVGVSMRFPPSSKSPVDTLELVLYYRDGDNLVDVASRTIEATGLSTTLLQDFSVYVPAVTADDAWAGRTIGVAIRAAGQAGGFWDLDNVRLAESPPPEDFTPPDKG